MEGTEIGPSEAGESMYFFKKRAFRSD